MSIILGALRFNTKKHLTEYTRGFLRSNWGKSLSPTKEGAFLMDLFQRHPNYAVKRGAGISKIRVDENRIQRGASHIVLERRDGSPVSISWRECIVEHRSTDGDAKCKQLLALRNAISGQIIEFKESTWQECAVCGSIQPPFQIDHVRDFKEVSEEFMAQNNLPVKFKSDLQGLLWFRAEDALIERKWQDFHRCEATLQKLCIKCHQEKTASNK